MFYVLEPDLKTPGKVRSRKIVPSNIEELLNPRVLAYWFMFIFFYKIKKKDDGASKFKMEKKFIC